ncbi:MAG: limonene-1,2-epoxide hydrolase family protein [Alphaproteobacteria bacterium]|nr:limonene-1,2-epoxide hydrolase family protein [Alphaproteobacteria bacterium]
MSAKDVVEKFLAKWNENDIDGAVDMLSEDVFYHNVPMEPVNGREAARQLLKGFGEIEDIDWETTAIAENGDLVLTERTDRFTFKGGRKLELPLMGIFKVKNGEIVEWKDYFDMADFQKQMAG